MIEVICKTILEKKVGSNITKNDMIEFLRHVPSNAIIDFSRSTNWLSANWVENRNSLEAEKYYLNKERKIMNGNERYRLAAKVSCPTCNAIIYESCINLLKGTINKYPHNARTWKALKAEEQATLEFP